MLMDISETEYFPMRCLFQPYNKDNNNNNIQLGLQVESNARSINL